VSHVAVRARNAGLLFASCYDADTLNRLKKLRGRHVRVRVNPAGDVLVEETAAEPARTRGWRWKPRGFNRPAPMKQWVLSEAEFKPGVTGAKALNLIGLAGKLPEWIHRPASIALPFGAFEQTLAAKHNRDIASRYDKLLGRLEKESDKTLPELRRTVLELEAPGDLDSLLRQKAGKARLTWPRDGSAAWDCIKRVWGSKWNDRAFYSRKAQGIPHENLFMAVLVQEVIEADYAFVIHTVNPFTNRPDELFVELVVGLGESLVGNCPGRALSAVCPKQSKAITLLAYPSKSHALKGGGLIFRSDSNGEDLAGYAGAGLYDSVQLPEPEPELVDYSTDPIVSDEEFRRKTLERLTDLGLAVETAAGSPQDIEGVLRQEQFYIVQTRPQVGIERE
jgi:alpha-glucan,water dikinase